MYVVLTVADDSPVFGRIDAIYVQDMRCVLLVQQCSSEYNSHLSAYKVDPTHDIAAYAPDELLDYYPLSGYIVNLHRYIVLKNFLYDKRQFDICKTVLILFLKTSLSLLGACWWQSGDKPNLWT